jgi:hypothetical protein
MDAWTFSMHPQYREQPETDLSMEERFRSGESLASRKPCRARAEAGCGVSDAADLPEDDGAPGGITAEAGEPSVGHAVPLNAAPVQLPTPVAVGSLRASPG